SDVCSSDLDPFRAVYSRWDGSQKGFELGADDILGELTDDLLYHGDVNAALRRMLQSGFEDRNGERIQGLREMLERLRQQRKERLDRFDLGGAYDEIAQDPPDVVDTERDAIDDLIRQARESGDDRRRELTEQSMQERALELDMLPNDLAGQVRGLQDYDFVSPEARQQFDELMDRLRQQLMQQALDQMSSALQNMTPEDMQRMKDML